MTEHLNKKKIILNIPGFTSGHSFPMAEQAKKFTSSALAFAYTQVTYCKCQQYVPGKCKCIDGKASVPAAAPTLKCSCGETDLT